MEVIAKNNMMGKKQVSEMKPVKEIKAEQMEMGIESRLLEEVKAAVFLAKQFPRDEIKAENKILELCKRKNFADTALYSFPRGGEVVQGLTIRFAEAVARAWGNIQYSVIELDTDDGKSTMLAYAWDVENNIKTTINYIYLPFGFWGEDESGLKNLKIRYGLNLKAIFFDDAKEKFNYNFLLGGKVYAGIGYAIGGAVDIFGQLFFTYNAPIKNYKSYGAEVGLQF